MEERGSIRVTEGKTVRVYSFVVVSNGANASLTSPDLRK